MHLDLYPRQFLLLNLILNKKITPIDKETAGNEEEGTSKADNIQVPETGTSDCRSNFDRGIPKQTIHKQYDYNT